MTTLTKESIAHWFKSLQDSICAQIEATDQEGKFREDLWTRDAGGGGRTRILQNGQIIEKGGVNFSAVEGPTPQKILDALKLSKSDFFATGVSIVMHPYNPFVPIIHMNVRYFEMSNGIKWFGGGIDLTPHYINEQDAIYFHTELKEICDQHNEGYYSTFKQQADDYFFLPHRNETRGIGGIFYDRLNSNSATDLDKHFSFTKSVGNAFAPIYCQLMARHAKDNFEQQHKNWQSLRRSRYVEFNLLFDKGTKFGIDTNGRTESILMSMPPMAQWAYCYSPEADSEEEKTQKLLRKRINWIK